MMSEPSEEDKRFVKEKLADKDYLLKRMIKPKPKVTWGEK
jgi:hypothetical protein